MDNYEDYFDECYYEISEEIEKTIMKLMPQPKTIDWIVVTTTPNNRKGFF